MLPHDLLDAHRVTDARTSGALGGFVKLVAESGVNRGCAAVPWARRQRPVATPVCVIDPAHDVSVEVRNPVLRN